MEKLLKIEDAAELLQVSRVTVLRLVRERKLGACKVGRLWRISQEHLDNFIKGGAAAK